MEDKIRKIVRKFTERKRSLTFLW